jgi:hypothetical protein
MYTATRRGWAVGRQRTPSNCASRLRGAGLALGVACPGAARAHSAIAPVQDQRAAQSCVLHQRWLCNAHIKPARAGLSPEQVSELT